MWFVAYVQKIYEMFLLFKIRLNAAEQESFKKCLFLIKSTLVVQHSGLEKRKPN